MQTGTGRIASPMRRLLGLWVAGLAVGFALTVAPASANMTIDGCVIISHPSPTHHTVCPGDDLGGANLGSPDLRCATLNGADLAGANLGGAKRGCSSSRSHGRSPVIRCRLDRLRGYFDVRVRHMSCSLGRRILAGAHLGDKRSRVRGFSCRQFSLSPQGVGFPYDVVCRKGPASVRAGVCDGPCGSSASALPKLLAGSYSGIRPRDVFFSGDAGNIVINIRWQHWNHTSGVGHGTSNILSCIPDCAQGKATPVATSVTFSKPVRGHFTKVVEVRARQTFVGHYPRSWPEGAQAAGAHAASSAANCGRVVYHYRVSGRYGGAFYAVFAGLTFHNGIYASGVGCAAARQFVYGYARTSLRHVHSRLGLTPRRAATPTFAAATYVMATM